MHAIPIEVDPNRAQQPPQLALTIVGETAAALIREAQRQGVEPARLLQELVVDGLDLLHGEPLESVEERLFCYDLRKITREARGGLKTINSNVKGRRGGRRYSAFGP